MAKKMSVGLGESNEDTLYIKKTRCDLTGQDEERNIYCAY